MHGARSLATDYGQSLDTYLPSSSGAVAQYRMASAPDAAVCPLSHCAQSVMNVAILSSSLLRKMSVRAKPGWQANDSTPVPFNLQDSSSRQQ